MDVNATVGELYRQGRLPLFHAKTGQPFYAPQGEGLEGIQARFDSLNAILAVLFRYKFGSRYDGGWARLSDRVNDNATRAVLRFDELVYKCNEEKVSCRPRVEVIEQPRRFGNLWARIQGEVPATLTEIDELDLLQSGQFSGGLDLPECVPLARVSSIIFELHVLISNMRAPNPSHAM